MSAPARRTLDSVTDPLHAALVSVPRAGAGICDVCHGVPGPGFSRCASCHRTVEEVSKPVTTIIPISLCEPSGQLYTVLRGYKDGALKEAREPLVLQIAGLIGRFLRDHRDCIVRTTGRDFDTIVTVPSSGGRSGTHPLEIALARLKGYESMVASLLTVGSVSITERAIRGR